jgi:hypothetical protein
VLQLLASGAAFDEILRDYPFLEREDILAAIGYPDRSHDCPGFVRFLVDNQLPAALQSIYKKGMDCEHVLEAGLAEASDADICKYAAVNGRIIIAKDEDFFHLSSRPSANSQLI